jgi:hypothetical protein
LQKKYEKTLFIKTSGRWKNNMRNRKLFGILMISILMICLLTGCRDKVKNKYSSLDDLDIEVYEENVMARIKITDSYTKDNIKYFIFTTNVSGERKFTLSEEEYDKFIGLNNDAVDCTIWHIKSNEDIFQDKYKTVANGNLTCYNLKNYLDENIPGFGSYSYYVGYSYPIGIESACDLKFKYSDYCIDMNDYENEETVYVRSNIDICRYSFLGEKGYTDKEVQEYKEVIDKVSKETADACEMLIKMKEK